MNTMSIVRTLSRKLGTFWKSVGTFATPLDILKYVYLTWPHATRQ